jgi:hypothetical protein
MNNLKKKLGSFFRCFDDFIHCLRVLFFLLPDVVSDVFAGDCNYLEYDLEVYR